MQPSVTCFVQARYLSSRLAGKVLKKLGNISVLELCVRRLQCCQNIDKIVVLTGNIAENIPIVDECNRLGISCFQGPEEDVLNRFTLASKIFDCDIIIRITADCPLVDPHLLSLGIENFKSRKYDYISNTLPPSFPDGLDFEIFSAQSLNNINRNAKSAYDREHVTPLLRNGYSFAKFNIEDEKDNSHIRWTLDGPDDFDLLDILVNNIKDPIKCSYEELLKAYFTLGLEKHCSQTTERNAGAMQKKSEKLYKRAKDIIPGGTSLLSKRPEMFDPKKWPAYFSKCKGIQLVTTDAENYLDFSTMSVGSCTLGYGNEAVDSAVIKSIKNGVSSSLNAPEEVFAAEKILELHPWAKMVRFARTGGEANAIAVRIARAATGKNKVALCGYHGWHDWYLAANLGSEEALDDMLLPGLSTKGVNKNLRGSTKTFNYGDKEGFLKSVDEDTACVVMEPCRNSEPDMPFLLEVRKQCSEKNIVLILDECSSGFRENYGGLHLKLGIEPDLCMVGKAIANGYALTAVFGTKEIMQSAQDTFISSTFWTERLGPTAAIACMNEMERLKSYDVLAEIGRKVQKCWSEAASSWMDIRIGGFDAIPNFTFNCEKPLNAKTLFTRLMLEEGYLATTAFYASIMHTEEEINKYGEACSGVFQKISKLYNTGELDDMKSSDICHSGFKRLN